MKLHLSRHWLRFSLLLTACGLATACDLGGGGSSRSTPVGPDLQGKWTGEFYIMRAANPRREAITATIKHDGDAIIIKTSKSGVGANLTGTIDADGEIVATDPLDGETWTTILGPATADRVRIADFIWDPLLGAQSPLKVIDLRR